MKDIREKDEEIKKKLHTSKPNGKDGKEQQQLFHAAYHMVSILEVIKWLVVVCLLSLIIERVSE